MPKSDPEADYDNVSQSLAFSKILDAIYAFATEEENIEDLLQFVNFVDAGAHPNTPFAKALEQHLERAQSVAQNMTSAPSVAEEAPFGFICFDKNARILDANITAIQLLDGIASKASTTETLSFYQPEDADQFEALFQTLKSGPNLPRLMRFNNSDGEAERLGYLVGAPLAGEIAANGSAIRNIHATLLLPPASAHLNNENQALSIGLTPAEARLAQKLQEGFSLKEAASDIGISHNTARNQLQSLFDKLGTRRQTELVRNLDALVFLHNKIHDQETSSAPTANEFSYPTHREMTLPDGRNLAWREYGAPQGDPIIMFGSVLSTSHLPKLESDLIRAHGYRMLCVERPGRGQSSFDPMATPVSVANDILRLCEELEISSASILGSASGSPFAVATAIALGDRANVLGLVSPRLYYNTASGMKQSLPARFYGAAARRPAAARYVLNIMKGRATKAITGRLIHRLYGDQPSDSHLLGNRPDLFDSMVLNAMESVTQQPEGIVHELSLLQEGNQLDYQRLNCPVIAWRGEHDNHLPLEDMEEVTQSFPFADIRTFADCGHLIFHKHTKTILENLRTTSNR